MFALFSHVVASPFRYALDLPEILIHLDFHAALGKAGLEQVFLGLKKLRLKLESVSHQPLQPRLPLSLIDVASNLHPRCGGRYSLAPFPHCYAGR